MLQRHLQHLPRIGPKREALLIREGCATWGDIAAAAAPCAGLDIFAWDEVRAAAAQSLDALARDDIAYFTARLPPAEHWRILARWFHRAAYFDIETSGLDISDTVTLICCLHGDTPLRFLADENIDHFLDLLDDIPLLVSFNGACFDVPRVLDHFHIPALPCPHIDLRTPCRHAGWTGGLKNIERHLGLCRPPDLEGLGGAEAVWLWHAWRDNRDLRARRTLERYCAADTVTLKLLAARLCRQHGAPVPEPAEAELWNLIHRDLPDLGPPGRLAPLPPPPAKPVPPPAGAADAFSLSQMLDTGNGLSRAEKQALLRERWRLHRRLHDGP